MVSPLDLGWADLRLVIDGQSFLDTPRLNLKSKSDAKSFLLSYGYDVDRPEVREEIWKIYFESLAFVRDHLLDSGEKIPQEFLGRGPANDILKLLTMAGSKTEQGKWSCALLRVMHIIAHLDNDMRLEIFQHAREQIFSRLDQHIDQRRSQRQKKSFVFNGPQGEIELVRYIKKERKERVSTLMKLLSKPHNVVEEIYDRIGIRFVTQTRADCFRLVDALIKVGVVSLPNLQPGRSVNSLLSLETVQRAFESAAEAKDRHPQRILSALDQESPLPMGTVARNPLSSRWYRALQFTCRQLVVAPDPTFVFWQSVKKNLQAAKVSESVFKRIPITVRESRSFFYPYEIQVMDRQSYVEAIGGRSRHKEYKSKQRLMARNRVLRDLV